MKKLTFLSTLIVAVSFTLAMAQMVPEPRATEVWGKEPVKVTPGENGSPPSDAIILDHSAWESIDGGENKWDDKDGVMTTVRMPNNSDLFQVNAIHHTKHVNSRHRIFQVLSNH